VEVITYCLKEANRQAEIEKAAKAVNQRSQKASWNQRKRQSSQPKKPDRQARISENAKAVNQRSKIGKLESAKAPKQSTEIAQ